MLSTKQLLYPTCPADKHSIQPSSIVKHCVISAVVNYQSECDQREAVWSTVVYRVDCCKTNGDSKELFDCICRGEIQLTMVNCGTLWINVPTCI